MQSVTYSQRIREVREYLLLAELATARLEQIIGASANLISVEWDLVKDEHGLRQLTLRLWDSTNEVRRSVAPEALKDFLYMSIWPHLVWGDMLALRSDQQHRKVEELIAAMEGG